MQQISMFKMPEVQKQAGNERGDLLKYFSSKINKPIGYVAMRLKGMDLQTLYFMKSQCDAEEKRGVPWSKVWFGSLKVRN